MPDLIALTHFLIIAATIGIPIISVALGQERASLMIIKALDEQPAAHASLRFLFFLGAAMLEFSSILSVVMAILFFYTRVTTSAGAIAQLGAALAFIVPTMIVGFAAAHPLAANIKALARQPLLQQKMLRLLLLTQIMLQTPILFGFIMGWLINASVAPDLTLPAALKLFASGLTFGFGSIGPLIGLAIFAQQASKAVGAHPDAYEPIFGFSFVSQGIIETPVLFVFVVSLWLWLVQPSDALWTSVAYVMIALTMGITTLPAGMNSGITAGNACQQIGMYTEHYPQISRLSLLGQIFIETQAMYGFIMSFIMLYLIP
jgi:F0F1-type ATP synthase membrane subunit c/vacuolar-type H+-ATPase subunit K